MNAPLRESAVEPVAALFAEHGDLVFRTLQYLGVPSGLVDDALQDVFITAHRRWDSFEGRSSSRTWLYGIARRVAWRYRRNHKTHGTRFVLTERPVEGVDAPFEQAHARKSIQALLAGLDEDKRAAFVLVEVEGFTAAEAAELLEIPLGTVYSRVRAAWSRLRDAAQDDLQVTSMRAELEPERRNTLQRALLAACIPSVAPTVATATTGLGWLWAAAAAGVVAVGIGVVGRPSTTPVPPEPRSVSARERPSPATVRPATVKHDAPLPEADPLPLAGPASEPVAEPEPVVPKPRTKPRPDVVEAPANTLAAEAKLIRRAKESVRDGDVEGAKKLLSEHERRFPRGQLGDEREEVRQTLADTHP